ncbi:MAG: hypothetical protein KGO05_00675 [Chloroflexota bacterium]|nr:hypothetical protein [Chloroflexota bacterium]
MATKRASGDRWAAILLWTGRIIAGAWAIIFLASLIGEVAGGYTPGGSALASAINFAQSVLMLLAVGLSFWRPWVGGVTLLVAWAFASLSLLLRLEPLSDVTTGLVFSALVALLPGLLLIAASLLRRQRAGAG